MYVNENSEQCYILGFKCSVEFSPITSILEVKASEDEIFCNFKELYDTFPLELSFKLSNEQY